MLSYASVLVTEPLATIPLEKRANAPSVIAPSAILIRERGFSSTLKDAKADNPPKKKAIEDTAPCASVKSFVKTPTLIAPIAIRRSSMLTVLKLGLCLRKYVVTSDNSPRRKADELKIMEDGPTPRSLM